MSNSLGHLRARVHEAREALEAEYEMRLKALGARVDRGRIVFEEHVRLRQRAARQRFWDYVRAARPMNIITAPVIYSVIVPFVLMDLWITLYMWICFPVYGIPRVRRRDHILIDRHMLPYLNWVQKFNCVYCGYGNGVVSYAREVAARTEAYWCPIKHAKRWDGAHDHYAGFMDYGDECDFVGKWAESRRKVTGGRDAIEPLDLND